MEDLTKLLRFDKLNAHHSEPQRSKLSLLPKDWPLRSWSVKRFMRATNVRDPAHGASDSYGLVALAFAVVKLGGMARRKAKRVSEVSYVASS